MFEKEWLPQALMIGISYNDFWSMNPRIIKVHINGYSMAKQREMDMQNALAHLQGQYFVEALMATVGNMFGGKTSRKFEYPKEPYGITKTEKSLSEEEKQKRVENFFMSLQIMQTNFELNHSDTDGRES